MMTALLLHLFCGVGHRMTSTTYHVLAYVLIKNFTYNNSRFSMIYWTDLKCITETRGCKIQWHHVFYWLFKRHLQTSLSSIVLYCSFADVDSGVICSGYNWWVQQDGEEEMKSSHTFKSTLRLICLSHLMMIGWGRTAAIAEISYN